MLTTPMISHRAATRRATIRQLAGVALTVAVAALPAVLGAADFAAQARRDAPAWRAASHHVQPPAPASLPLLALGVVALLALVRPRAAED